MSGISATVLGDLGTFLQKIEDVSQETGWVLQSGVVAYNDTEVDVSWDEDTSQHLVGVSR